MPRKMLSVPSVATIDGTRKHRDQEAVDHAQAGADPDAEQIADGPLSRWLSRVIATQ